MLVGQPEPLQTQRLQLQPIEPAHAEAMWPVLRDPALYKWIDRAPPAHFSDVQARFARISQGRSPDRDEQWLNWTVWTGADVAIGIVEATVRPGNEVAIGYMFGADHWGKGYAREAIAAAIAAMSGAGAAGFEAVIDARNTRSLALIERLGFQRSEVRAAAQEEVWRRQSG
ncbi:MAG: GNAT family N-acetyltransferase [Phycisphaerales bacterium]|nr:GNAT family N-acetyltransferase [Hyphomonadaceae bacterium]